MDTIITYLVSINFVIFFLLHLVIFRYINQRAVILWLARLLISIWVITSIGWILSSWNMQDVPIGFAGIVMVLVFTFLLYGLVSVAFVMCTFGIIESSIRMNMLREIAKTGKRGMTESALRAKYNMDIILKKRLERFVQSGELKRMNGKYSIQSHHSIFFLPVYYFAFIWCLYRDEPFV